MPEDRSSAPAVAMGTPEFSRLIAVSRIDGPALAREIVATEAECTALAKRFGLESLGRLAARVSLKRIGREDIRLDAVLSAQAVQNCVVTLAPLPVALEEEFSLVYRAGLTEEDADLLALENPDDEIVEPLMGDSIDIGEAVAQQLSVALDPFPRAEGAAVPEALLDAEDGLTIVLDAVASDKNGRPNPFAVLQALKKH
jgi:uncharacterized metal-binding protein YceD (DUF177 family)